MKKTMYRERVIHAGNTIEVIDTYPTQFGDNLRREGRKSGKGTPEAIKRYNQKLAKRRLTRLINANFIADDIWVTLTYEQDNRPKDKQTAKKVLSNFIRRLKRVYQKADIEFKAIKCTALGERGALHHHIIIPQGVATKDITRLWRDVTGASAKAHPPYYVPLYPEGEFSSLASYLVEQLDIDCDEPGERKWTCTHNLIKPWEEPPKDIEAITWQEPPVPRDGYYIDTFSIEAGTNEITGRPYLFYRMVKIEEGYTCRDENGKLLKGKAAVDYVMLENRKFIRDNWIIINQEGEVVFINDG